MPLTLNSRGHRNSTPPPCPKQCERLGRRWTFEVLDFQNWMRDEIIEWNSRDPNGPPQTSSFNCFVSGLDRRQSRIRLIGYIELDRSVTLSTLNRWFPYAHWAVAHETSEIYIRIIDQDCDVWSVKHHGIAMDEVLANGGPP